MSQFLIRRSSFETPLTPEEIAELFQQNVQETVELYRTRHRPFSGNPVGLDFVLSFRKPRRKRDPLHYDPQISVSVALRMTPAGTTVNVRVAPPVEVYFFPLVLFIPALYYHSLNVFLFAVLALAPYIFLVDSAVKTATRAVRDLLAAQQ